MKLHISQMVLERVEFKHRDDYLAFAPTTLVPQSGVDVSVEVARAEQDPNGAALVRLTAKSAEDAIYQFWVTYTALYSMQWDDQEEIPSDLDRRLTVTGALMLFPFIREAVANVTARGRFGPTWLAPLNFNALTQAASEPEPVAAGE